jgi:hypothetical protein
MSLFSLSWFKTKKKEEESGLREFLTKMDEKIDKKIEDLGTEMFNEIVKTRKQTQEAIDEIRADVDKISTNKEESIQEGLEGIEKAIVESHDESFHEEDCEEENDDYEDDAWEEEEDDDFEDGPTAPQYRSYKCVNKVLTLVDLDGDIHTKQGSNDEDLEKIAKARCKQDILDIFYTEEQKEVDKKVAETKQINDVIRAKNKELGEKIQGLFDKGDFELKEGCVYLKGVNRTVPNILVEELVRNLGNTLVYNSLKNFWGWCCLNPNVQAAEDLYEFLRNGDFKINKYGCFFAYRRVLTVAGAKKVDTDYIDFVTNAFNKVKAVWKKNPINFIIRTTSDGYELVDVKKRNITLTKDDKTLKDLYDGLATATAQCYTDNHTKKEDYRPNTVISMDRSRCDGDNSQACSKGYHVGNKNFGSFNGVGDQQILVLVNPRDVVAVPKHDKNKMRVCRWYFVMTLDKNEQFILDDDGFDTKNIGLNFAIGEMRELESVKDIETKDIEIHAISRPLEKEDFIAVVASLSEMKDQLKERVVAKV